MQILKYMILMVLLQITFMDMVFADSIINLISTKTLNKSILGE